MWIAGTVEQAIDEKVERERKVASHGEEKKREVGDGKLIVSAVPLQSQHHMATRPSHGLDGLLQLRLEQPFRFSPHSRRLPSRELQQRWQQISTELLRRLPWQQRW